MRCPFCGHEETQVKDSRPTEDNSKVEKEVKSKVKALCEKFPIYSTAI